MSLTKVINTGIKNAEITGSKINTSSSFSFDVLQANTLTIANDLQSNTTNLIFDTANSSGVYANAAFNFANTISGGAAIDNVARTTSNSASSYANGAFESSNVTNTLTQSAYNQVNTTNSTAQAAFDAANNAVDTWVRDASNSASSYANGAYDAANTSDQRAITSGDYANSGYNQANTANVTAHAAFEFANTLSGGSAIDITARTTANASYDQANTAITDAAQADQRAVTSGVYANSGFSLANTANSTAQAAFDAANNAVDTWVRDASNSASSYANSAYAEANTKTTTTYVDNAIANLVNSAPATLDTLNELAEALNNDPNFATTIASNIGIIGNYANSAYVQANTPSQVANSASSYANGAYGQANTATTNASQADQRAVTSGVYANGAYLKANTAHTSALQADQRAVTSGLYANAAYDKANSSINAQSGGAITGDISITGNLTVTGCTATLIVATLKTSDHIIDIGYGTTGVPVENAGLRVFRGDENPVQLRWVESDNYWEYSNDGTNYLRIGSKSGEQYANAAYTQANTPSHVANSSSSYANGAFSQANTANTLAQAAYDQANTGGGGGSGLFNSAINVAVGYAVTSTLANAVVFSANSIVHSIYLTNISDDSTSNTQVTGDFTPSGSSNVSIFYKIPLPHRSSVEMLKKPQVVKTNDILKLQSFEDDVPASSNAYAIIVYETTDSAEYERVGKLLTDSYANMYTSTSNPSVLESIKLVNQDSAYGNHAITVVWTNSSNTLQGYFTKELILPANCTIELCETPKYLNAGDKIDAFSSVAGSNKVSILVSAKKII